MTNKFSERKFIKSIKNQAIHYIEWLEVKPELEEIIEINKHLKENYSVGYLEISFHSFDYKQIAAIGKLIESCVNLSKIALEIKDLDKIGKAIIAEAIRKNQAVTTLEILDEILRKDDISTIRDLIEKTKVNKIELNGSCLSERGLAELEEILKSTKISMKISSTNCKSPNVKTDLDWLEGIYKFAEKHDMIIDNYDLIQDIKFLNPPHSGMPESYENIEKIIKAIRKPYDQYAKNEEITLNHEEYAIFSRYVYTSAEVLKFYEYDFRTIFSLKLCTDSVACLYEDFFESYNHYQRELWDF